MRGGLKQAKTLADRRVPIRPNGYPCMLAGSKAAKRYILVTNHQEDLQEDSAGRGRSVLRPSKYVERAATIR